jgi:hypothetical protein
VERGRLRLLADELVEARAHGAEAAVAGREVDERGERLEVGAVD